MAEARDLGDEEVEQAVERLSTDETIRLARRLDEETFGVRFKALVNQIRARAAGKISEEEITAEVEDVRRHRATATAARHPPVSQVGTPAWYAAC